MQRVPTALFDNSTRRSLRSALLRWYRLHRRPLPWRVDCDPYRVWVSEIMLQQTRVSAVIEHYRQFLEHFPDVQALARSSEARVLAAWSGLGYYRRARMMHSAARQLVRECEGQFPQDAAGWQSLPGIGRYTAAAIASICFDEPCAVVDGNVERVLERMLGQAPPNPWSAANELLSHQHPGDFNQAMMELGATVCVPRDPQCELCPIARWCHTAKNGQTNTRERRAPRIKCERSCALVTKGNKVLLVRRPKEASVMPDMWELPPIEFRSDTPRMMSVRHAIMNTDYLVHVVSADYTEVADSLSENRSARWIEVSRRAELPLTGLARKILRRSGII